MGPLSERPHVGRAIRLSGHSQADVQASDIRHCKRSGHRPPSRPCAPSVFFLRGGIPRRRCVAIELETAMLDSIAKRGSLHLK